MTVSRSALLVGATGLVGAHLLKRLLARPEYGKVTAWVRREAAFQNPKLTQIIVDFQNLQQYGSQLDAEDVFVTLGTTIKQAGSQQAFRRVDYDFPLEVARLAKQSGARRFLMVSALGADANSRVFYSRVKGEAESAIRALGLPKVWFFRPSLLVGERVELRAGEKVGAVIGKVMEPLLIGTLRKYRPIAADAVAAAMVHAATLDDPAPGIIESDQIARLAALSTVP
jgi:uncharacterized protein YbjT (DUF2867 family)